MYIASQISIYYANAPRNATVSFVFFFCEARRFIRAVDGTRSGSDSKTRRIDFVVRRDAREKLNVSVNIKRRQDDG